MSLSVFDAKIFNGEVFKGYVDRLPNPKKNELIKCKALRPRPDLAGAMADQDGGNYITTTLNGLITGAPPQNYDGSTNLTSNGTVTFRHSRVVVGRMNAWTEKDFSYDITGGQEFLENVAEQITEYWDEIDQATLVAILTGIFNMTGAENIKFVKAHTYDVTAKKNSENVLGFMDGTTLNTGMQRACGDNKSKFSLSIMHSYPATNLENLKLLAYLKYTDAQGIERELGLATLNGRLVLIDDSMPVEEGYYPCASTDEDAIKVVANNATPSDGEMKINTVTPYFGEGTPAANDYVVKGTRYTTFVLGDGAIEYTDCGAKVPYEPARDPYTNGGQDTLISRQRKCFAPFGISFTMESMATLSPTDQELALGVNWELVSTVSDGEKQYIAHKTIPIARILSRG